MRVYSNISHATRNLGASAAPWMPAALPDFDSTAFRSALGRFATGVTVVTAMGADGRPVGLTVSSFNSVSLSPPLVLWSLSLTSGSLPVLEAASHYAVNVLAADQIDVARRFATRGTLRALRARLLAARPPRRPADRRLHGMVRML